jgi:polyphosphate kinase 2 (PPK2 family)
VMGFCTDDQYRIFLQQAPVFEELLTSDGIHLIKLWFSVSRAEQRTRFLIRRIDPVRQWKLSETDLASLGRWDDYTVAKEIMFRQTDTLFAPWTVVKSNDKKRARIGAMRFVLNQFDYPNRDESVVLSPDPLIVGPAAQVYEHGETPGPL